jgi:hypothetical protein
MTKKKLRPLGHITQDLEPLYQEMAWEHELQAHEMLGIQHSYIKSHLDASLERYNDGTDPIYFYGHIDDLIALAKRLKKLRSKA